MGLVFDHAVFAWDDHADLVDACESVGLEPAFGGEHDGPDTQMSLVGFPDGSYLELIAPTDPGSEPDGWAGLFDDWSGPEHWCVEADVRSLLRRTIAAGAPVDGPHPGSRRRPDGTLVEWTTGTYGPESLRSVLPFAISDRTPHDHRVPDHAVTDGPLTGVTEAVVGVESSEPAGEWFRRLHEAASPAGIDTALDADVSTVPGQPLSFAVPHVGSRLEARVEAVGEQPVAFLLGTEEFESARERYDLVDPEPWGDGRVAWFDADPLRGRLGVVSAPAVRDARQDGAAADGG